VKTTNEGKYFTSIEELQSYKNSLKKLNIDNDSSFNQKKQGLLSQINSKIQSNNLSELESLKNDNVGRAYQILLNLETNFPNKEDDKEKLYSDIDKILGSKTSVLFDKGAVTNKNIGDVFPTMAAFQRRDRSKTRDHFVNQAKAKRPVITAASNLFRGIFRDPNEEE
jgi:hypothetical protein